MPQLILVRHGQTAANAAGLLQGHRDLPLNDVGRAQATALARVLAPVVAQGARVVCSPLRRAWETASTVASEVFVDPAWIEMDYGTLDGASPGDIGADVWRRWRADEHFAPAGGESHHRLHGRVFEACVRAAEQATDIIVVSHVSPIKAAVAWALGAAPHVVWRMHLDQASITRIRFTEDGGVLLGFNNTSHL